MGLTRNYWPSDSFSGFWKCRFEPKTQPYIDAEISGLTLSPYWDVNKPSKVVLFIRIQLFRILQGNTTMHDYTTSYNCYCLCIAGHKFYYIITISKVKAFVFLIEYNFCMIWLMTYFWFTHLHTASLLFILLLIQSQIVGNSEIRTVFPQINAIFV